MAGESRLTLNWELRQGEILGRGIAGSLDESFRASVVDPGDARQMVLDLSQVTHASSFGVREWVRAIGVARQAVDGLFFVQVSPRILDQLNMVVGFAGGAVVLSFYGIHVCDACGADELSLYDAQLDRQAFQTLTPPLRQCRVCGSDTQLDDDPAVLFEYVRSAEVVSPPASVVGFLRQPGTRLFEVPGLRLAVRQTMALSMTRFQFAGIIDQGFRGRRLVDAAAPAVTIDVEHVRHFDPSGFVHWRTALDELARQGPVLLAGCPPPMMKRMSEDPRLIGPAQVQSISAPLECPKCKTCRWVTLPLLTTDPAAAGPCAKCGEAVSAFRQPDLLAQFRDACRNEPSRSAPLIRVSPEKPPDRDVATKASTGHVELISGKYEVLCKLAEGGMAQVALVRQHGAMGFRRLAVIKTVRDEFLTDDRRIRLFLEEAKLVARIDYPHVIRVYDLDRVDGSLLMVLEFVHGRNLGEIMRAIAPAGTGIPPAIAATIVADLCLGLGRAHQSDSSGRVLVHRDVAPGNVMVTFDGVVKLVDFGLAAWQRSVEEKDVLLGNPSWMAPECYQEQDATPQTDIWGAGLLLLSTILGRNPFRRATVPMTAVAILRETLQLGGYGATLPRKLHPIIERCLDKDPGKRYADAVEIAADLRAVIPKLGEVNIPSWMGKLFSASLKREEAFARSVGQSSLIDALLVASPQAVAQYYSTIGVDH